jgi:hypothetical protein
MDHDPRKYLKPAQTAKKLEVTVGTLANWRYRKIGPPYYTPGGNMVRYADDELDRWIAASRQDTVGPNAGERPPCK